MKNLVMTTLAIAGLASATFAATVSEKNLRISRQVSSVSFSNYDNSLLQDTSKHKGKKGDHKAADKKHEHHKKEAAKKSGN